MASSRSQHSHRTRRGESCCVTSCLRSAWLLSCS
uniref:Uncharacterized protein n=1 Tax=Myoviridae sp. ctEg02 TaxID=2825061 RepID=A0A8S5PRI5_9CAUD|nr:MAG TPA: hypothetical protein [Myoviridae sp. ctEg02]